MIQPLCVFVTTTPSKTSFVTTAVSIIAAAATSIVNSAASAEIAAVVVNVLHAPDLGGPQGLLYVGGPCLLHLQQIIQFLRLKPLWSSCLIGRHKD